MIVEHLICWSASFQFSTLIW